MSKLLYRYTSKKYNLFFHAMIYEYCQQLTNSVHIFVFIFSWHLYDGYRYTAVLYCTLGTWNSSARLFRVYMRHHIIAASRADANKIFQFENRRDLRKNRLERDTHFRGRNLTTIISVACRDLFPRDRRLRRNIASVGLSDRVLEFNNMYRVIFIKHAFAHFVF